MWHNVLGKLVVIWQHRQAKLRMWQGDMATLRMLDGLNVTEVWQLLLIFCSCKLNHSINCFYDITVSFFRPLELLANQVFFLQAYVNFLDNLNGIKRVFFVKR